MSKESDLKNELEIIHRVAMSVTAAIPLPAEGRRIEINMSKELIEDVLKSTDIISQFLAELNFKNKKEKSPLRELLRERKENLCSYCYKRLWFWQRRINLGYKVNEHLNCHLARRIEIME